MRELDECLELAKKIKDKEEEIYVLKAKVMSPKNQIISDMPKGKSGSNEIENYILKLEHIEPILSQLKIERNCKWEKVATLFLVNNIADAEEMKMLYLRFYKGMSWNKVAAKKKWKVDKCFRVYRTILEKMHKKDV